MLLLSMKHSQVGFWAPAPSIVPKSVTCDPENHHKVKKRGFKAKTICVDIPLKGKERLALTLTPCKLKLREIFRVGRMSLIVKYIPAARIAEAKLSAEALKAVRALEVMKSRRVGQKDWSNCDSIVEGRSQEIIYTPPRD